SFSAGVRSFGSRSFGRRGGSGNSSAVEKFHRFLLAQGVTDSTETAFAKQTLAHLLEGLVVLFGEFHDLRVDLIVIDVNVLLLGDSVEEESDTYVALGGVALTITEALEVHAPDVVFFHALRHERAETTVETMIDGLVDQNVGDGEVSAGQECVDDLVFGLVLNLMLAFLEHALADTLASVV